MNEAAKILTHGGLVVMRSDTIYGVFASALSEKAIQKLHVIRSRRSEQGFIVLIDSVETAAKMVDLRDEVKKRLETVWRAPYATSVILAADAKKFPWLYDRCEKQPRICFRVPHDEGLRELLCETGPLCAPSANPPDELPAQNIAEARVYFGDAVDLYIDGGECLENAPSRIIKFRQDGTIETVRPDGYPRPEDFVITRRRKLYKFAQFDEMANCFQLDEWVKKRDAILHEVTKSSRDLAIEIGAGSALFSVELAQQNPEKLFIATDIKSDRLYQGAREAAKLGLKNIYFVRTDIAHITDVVPAHAAGEIWLTFPDPFVSNDQKTLSRADAKHRLTAPRYLDYYREILKTDGNLNFKTDNLPLFEWSLEQFAANSWKKEFETCDLHNSNTPDETKIMTSYEQRFVVEGLKINYAKFTLQS